MDTNDQDILEEQTAPPRKRKKKKSWIIVLVIWLILAAALGTGYYFMRTPEAYQHGPGTIWMT